MKTIPEIVNFYNDDQVYITTEDQDLIKKHFSDVTIDTIYGTGHWLHAESPDIFYQKSLDFLRK